MLHNSRTISANTWTERDRYYQSNLSYLLCDLLDVFTPGGLVVVTVMDPSVLSSPGFEETARLVLPVLGYSEQLLQAGHGFLHRWMRHQADSLVDEPPHGLQSPGGRLSAGLLRPLQPACLLQPHSQAGQLRQLYVEVKADVQQALDLSDAGNFVCQDLLTVLLEVFDAIQEFLKTLVQTYRKSNYNQ